MKLRLPDEPIERVVLIKKACLFCAGWVTGNAVIIAYLLYRVTH